VKTINSWPPHWNIRI